MPALETPPLVDAADAFKALGDPARLRIVELLAEATQPQCVCHLTPALGLAQPTVSHHLRVLREAGLLRRERRGTWAYYSLDEAALERVRDLVPRTGAPR